ncbi:MAG: oligosaccharide flippase family protein [Candidatus Omnitrophica bacterium]|nr:oligosaccharide flippase family protein [Candidatus Omnitrophota bacterium]
MSLSLSASLFRLYHRGVASRFIRDISTTLATRVVLGIMGLFLSVLTARLLGPDGRGMYAVAVTLSALGVQFSNLGLHSANTYFVAGDRRLLGNLFANSLGLSFVLGGICALLAWGTFLIWPVFSNLRGNLLLLSLCWIPFGLAYLLLQNLLLGIQKIGIYNGIELVMQFSTAIIILVLIPLRAISAETVFMAGFITLIGSLLWLIGKFFSFVEGRPSLSLVLLKEHCLYGAKAYLSAIFVFLVMRIGVLMIQNMLGAQQTGYFSVAAALTDTACLLPAVVSTILFSRLCSMNSIGEKWKLVRKTVVVFGLGIMFIAVLLGCCAGPLIALVYGNKFAPAAGVFVWLLPGFVFLGLQTIAVQFLNSIGFPREVVFIWAFAAIITIVLNVLAIPAYGIMGVAYVYSATNLIVLLLVSLLIRNKYLREIAC